MSKVEERLNEMGLTLPVCPVPVAAYVPVQRAGDMIYASGQTAGVDGVLHHAGKLGSQVSVEDGYESAKLSVLNCLSAIKTIIDLDDIRIIRVTAYVNSEPDFIDQPKVVNGASDLLEKLFGENGKHARSAVGVAVLPNHASVEVEVIAQAIR